jgi:hypothetical protein
LSDDIIASSGLDPASKNVTTDAPEGPATWRVCSWQPADKQYSIGVYSTSHTLDETRDRQDLTDFQDVTVGSRNGVTYRDTSDPKGDACFVAFPAEQGMFNVDARWLRRGKRDVDICTIAVRQATSLEPSLPK